MQKVHVTVVVCALDTLPDAYSIWLTRVLTHAWGRGAASAAANLAVNVVRLRAKNEADAISRLARHVLPRAPPGIVVVFTRGNCTALRTTALDAWKREWAACPAPLWTTGTPQVSVLSGMTDAVLHALRGGHATFRGVVEAAAAKAALTYDVGVFVSPDPGALVVQDTYSKPAIAACWYAQPSLFDVARAAVWATPQSRGITIATSVIAALALLVVVLVCLYASARARLRTRSAQYLTQQPRAGTSRWRGR